MTFMQLYRQGKATADQINDYIDEWHKSKGTETIHEFLGMTKDEYCQWLKNPDYLKELA